jgi:hypothetical protein
MGKLRKLLEFRSYAANRVRDGNSSSVRTYSLFNLVGVAIEADDQSVEQLPLLWVGGEIADQGALGCVSPELSN